MASKTSICNLALSHIGVGHQIANLETDKGEQARACRLFFETARDATLRDFSWPFATRFATLSLVKTDPTKEWKFAYRYPNNCISVLRIISGFRNETQDQRVPYKIMQDNEGKLILTDQPDAQVEFTTRVDNPAYYPDDFVITLSLRLAAYIAPRLTGGDPYKLGDRALKYYQFEGSKAEATARNEEQGDVQPDSEFISVRD